MVSRTTRVLHHDGQRQLAAHTDDQNSHQNCNTVSAAARHRPAPFASFFGQADQTRWISAQASGAPESTRPRAVESRAVLSVRRVDAHAVSATSASLCRTAPRPRWPPADWFTFAITSPTCVPGTDLHRRQRSRPRPRRAQHDLQAETPRTYWSVNLLESQRRAAGGQQEERT